MKASVVLITIVAGLMTLCGLAAAKEEMGMSWDKGTRFQSADAQFKFKFGGRIMNDWAWFSFDNELEDADDGTEFRRARLYLAGLIYHNVDFKAQYDFAGGDADFKDMWIGYRDFPLGHIKVGHFKEPFGLEEFTSSKYITFMERSLPTEAFSPGRNTGFGISATEMNDMLTWSVGAFRDSDGFGESQGNDYDFSARVTFLPWYEAKGSNLLHLGAAASYKSVEQARYRARPESHLSSRLVDTKSFLSDNAYLVGLESALVLGPFSLQGEYIMTAVDFTGKVEQTETGSEIVAPASGGDPEFFGYYVYASYFLTGEHRAYKKTSGAFNRVKPTANAGADGGAGAWEVAARYSSVDLSDGGIDGGELDDITLALNWYLNPNTRVMFNYVNADAEQGSGDIFQTRFQIDF